jgi:hypothetical protein
MKKFLLVFSMMIFVGSMAIAQTTAPAAGAKAEKASTEKVKAQDTKAKTECNKDAKGAACCSDKSADKSKSCAKSCCDKSKADGNGSAQKAKKTAKSKDTADRQKRANGGAVAAKKE